MQEVAWPSMQEDSVAPLHKNTNISSQEVLSAWQQANELCASPTVGYAGDLRHLEQVEQSNLADQSQTRTATKTLKEVERRFNHSCVHSSCFTFDFSRRILFVVLETGKSRSILYKGWFDDQTVQERSQGPVCRPAFGLLSLREGFNHSPVYSPNDSAS